MLQKLNSKFFKKWGLASVVEYKGLNLPTFRTNQGLSDNEDYLTSGVEQLAFLHRENLLHDNSKVLDFGCGQGRFVNSLEYSRINVGEYLGIDTSRKSIDWCSKYLNYSSKYRFIHLPAHNARYNPKASGVRTLPVTDSFFDLIFLNSVFSHMLPDDVAYYLAEFHRVLKIHGSIYLTAFIEDDVEDVVENPQGYISKSSGPLHRVRYRKRFFYKMIEDSNLKVRKCFYRQISRTQQSVLIITKN